MFVNINFNVHIPGSSKCVKFVPFRPKKTNQKAEILRMWKIQVYIYIYSIYTYVSNVSLLGACRDVPWLMACLGVQDCEDINWAELCGRSLPAGKCFHVQRLG